MQPKAYSYLRFSTPEQATGDSSRRQIEAAERWAAKNEMTLDTSLRMEDRGVSAFRGKNARTGALGAFLAAVDDGVVTEGSYLLVENLDRVSRADPWDALPVFQQIINAGVIIVTLMDGRAYSREMMRTNPMVILESLFVMVRANQESATKARRVSAAWDGKRANAATRPLTSVCPAWVTLDKATRTFSLIPERAEVVKRIFAMTLAGVGLDSIAVRFNVEEVPCFGDAQRWHRSYVKKIRENPAVIGTMVPHKLDHTGGKRVRVPLDPVPGYYPAAVDAASWEAVQALRTGLRAPRSGSKPAPLGNLLASLARCPKCEGSMTRVTKGNSLKGGRPYLICAKAKAGAGCTYRAVPMDDVERAIVDRFWIIAKTPPADPDAQGDQLRALQAALEAAETGVEKLTSAITLDPLPSLVAKLRHVEAERDQARAALDAAAKTRVAASTPMERNRRAAELVVALEAETLNREQINSLLRQCFSYITVDYTSDPGPAALIFAWKHGALSMLPFETRDRARKAA